MNTNHFTHLHLHTEYSLLDGAIRIPDLVAAAKDHGWQALGISDHGNIFGAVTFFQACKKSGIKPILGCEMYLTADVSIKDAKEKYFHLLVIVQNEIGYRNLCRLMAFAYQEGFYFKPRIDYERLAQHSEGLIVSTACLGGHIPSLLRDGNGDEARKRAAWFLDVFGRDRFFLEVMPPEYEKQRITNELLFTLADEMNISCIATGDAHYLKQEDHEAHEVLLSVQTHGLITDANRYSFGEARCFLRSTNDMLAAFPGREEAIWNTGKIADQCNFEFEKGKLYFPAFPVPDGHTEETYFRHLCAIGLNTLHEKNLIPPQEYQSYQARLTLEMDLIVQMGFVGYFLVVSDFIGWAKQNGIAVGPGRGSVAGSLIAWALGITNVDPIRYNLLFERFLNPERVSMPDIDIDFCIERREEVIEYVRRRYGSECVCQIITFGTMMAKGVIKDVARTLGFPFKDANALTDLVPDQLKITIDEAIAQEPRLKDMIDTNPQVRKLIDICKKLEGLTRHASKHAAGVVISPRPLRDMLPLYVPSKSDELVAQYAMTELESVGFLKMDFLGLKNLTLIERTRAAIARNHKVHIDLDLLPLDDTKTFDLLRAGHTDGVFQFESDGIKDVLCKLQPQRFEDLIAVNALYRPGPLGSGMVDDYIDRRHGRTQTTYMFKELEPILAETYGVIVYQEQVMKIASAIAGYSLGGADILRRAMGKKKAEEMAQQKDLFVRGAISRGFDEKKSAELFDLMAYFAGYGFNKSHSTAYALIAYHTAYLKANYPVEFMAALVTFETAVPEKLTQYLQEINDMGITVLPPDINVSDIEFRAHEGTIIFGLRGIRNVGDAALAEIIATRTSKPFSDLFDFCRRVDLRVVNKRVIESLIATGAFDKQPGNRAQKSRELEKIIALATEQKEAAITGQMSLFGAALPGSTDSHAPYQFEPCDDWTDAEKLEKEKELAGFYLSSHPLKMHQHILQCIAHHSFKQAHELINHMTSIREPEVTCVGLLLSHRIITTKKGDRMAFAQFEDGASTAEVVLFPRIFAKVSELLDKHTVFLIRGTLDATAAQQCKIKANALIPIELLFDDPAQCKEFHITLPEATPELLSRIKPHLKAGSVPLRIIFFEKGKKISLNSRSRISISKDLLATLRELDVSSSIVMH